MKTFLIIFIIVSSALSAIFLNTQESLQDKPIKQTKSQPQTLKSQVNENLNLVRSISKEGNLTQALLFQTSSSQIQKILQDKNKISDKFIHKYEQVQQTVNALAQNIALNHPKLSINIQTMNQKQTKFDKKIKSIGLAELKKSWTDAKKAYQYYLRNPNDNTYKKYEKNYTTSKAIITELYLDDEDEEYLFDYLAKQYFVRLDIQVSYGYGSSSYKII